MLIGNVISELRFSHGSCPDFMITFGLHLLPRLKIQIERYKGETTLVPIDMCLKRLAFLFLIVQVITLTFGKNLSLHFRGSNAALSWFNEMKSYDKIQSRIECGVLLMPEIQLDRGASSAFKYDNVSKICSLGNLGPFEGDLETVKDFPDIKGVYFPPSCLGNKSNTIIFC